MSYMYLYGAFKHYGFLPFVKDKPKFQGGITPATFASKRTKNTTSNDYKSNFGAVRVWKGFQSVGRVSDNSESLGELKRNEATIQLPGRENISEVSLRSGKIYQSPSHPAISPATGSGQTREGEGESNVEDRAKEKGKENVGGEASEESQKEEAEKVKPYPYRGMVTRRKEAIIDVANMFKDVDVKVPLLTALKMPPISKFIKDYLAGKVNEEGRLVTDENVSAVIQRSDLPSKKTDPGMFTLSISIGDIQVEHAMCDLGASINVLPYSIYRRLGAANLVDTDIMIQLADRSCIHPEGILEDVIVKVNNFLCPADFFVIKMTEPATKESSGVLLGRPFLSTASTIIDVRNGMISLDFKGEQYTFNIDEAVKKPTDGENVYSIDVTEPLVQEYLEEELLKRLFTDSAADKVVEKEVEEWYDTMKVGDMDDQAVVKAISEFCGRPRPAGSSRTAQVSSLAKRLDQGKTLEQEAAENPLPNEEPKPAKELKPLPAHLKYAYLGEGETMPVIINNHLTQGHEDRLLEVLRRNQKAIGWKLTDLVGISPDLCMHHIRLKEGAKPHRDQQRKLNPNMRAEVLKEIVKLVSIGIIYSIPDSNWVSPMHMVPKKGGIQVLAGKQYFGLLDGYSGYFQITVNPDDQEKTTFTCPFGTYAYRRMPFGLCNAPGTFQRCMMSIFSDLLEDCIEIFMDDFTVYGDDFDQGLHSLNRVLERCRQKDLVLNFEKCHFMVTEGIVLGHVVSSRGIEVNPAKVAVIAKLPYPTNQKEIRAFLGHAGFYRRFIKDFTKIAQPLTRLLQNDVEFEFSDACKAVFQFLKDRLISFLIIRAPNWNHPFEAQKNYDVTEKEMLSIVFAFEKFRPYLLGSKWINQAEEIAQANKGSKGQNTSKEPWFADIANYLVTGELPRSDEISRAQKLKLKSDSRYFYWDDPYLWKMGADQVIRRCIPEWEQEDVMIHCHTLACGGHFRLKKTTRKILDSGFYWSSIHRDAYEFCKKCPRCQLTGGISTRDEMPQIPIIVCEIFDVWGMDFMGQFPASEGNLYILVAVDYVSKWIKAKATRTCESKEVAKFLKSNIFTRYGVPRAIISD
ncbi:uncharacterized protein LOC121776825 [Salvia splendens]|uniref:uncharacterized protein LOC121776825 n=1 Tax=Salvia splendens TaxID=180675 RepID=UPI001C25A462|nr:uncharacterized protein LOC121776825 [Salvia splendens]